MGAGADGSSLMGPRCQAGDVASQTAEDRFGLRGAVLLSGSALTFEGIQPGCVLQWGIHVHTWVMFVSSMSFLAVHLAAR